MTGNKLMFATPPAKAKTTDATVRSPEVKSQSRPAEDTIVLDMGEASREQGFRLNGCR